MSHYLTVSDPWFGEYVHLTLPGTEIEILLGPLYQRAIRLERISNQGPRARQRSFTEKSCQHSYVEGTITGNVNAPEWTTHPKHWWPLGGGSFHTDFEGYMMYPEGFRYECDLSVSSEESDTALICTATYHVDEKSIPDPWHTGQGTWSLVMVFRKVKLSDGAVEYSLSATEASSVVTEGYWGNAANTHVTGDWQSEIISSPFGEGGDVLGIVASQTPKLIERLDEAIDRAGKKVSARDAAIYDALNSISLADLNPIEELETLLAPLEPLRQLWKLVHGMNNFIDIIRHLASMHLFYKYVVKTGIMGAKEWMKLLDVLCHPEKLHATFKSVLFIGRGRVTKSFSDDGVDVTVTTNVKLTYGKGGMQMLDLMNLLGLTPRLADLWDIVPYSFVVDWVIPIGDAINNLELNSLQQQLDFNSGVGSVKVKATISRDFTVGAHSFTANITSVTYDRTVWSEFPTDVWLGVSFKGLPTKQLLTGGALLVQFLAK